MARKAVLPAHQARSRESMRRLLDAAIEVVGQYGIEGATIPRIALHAGLTSGSVYRRFQDKDALLEKAILEILVRQDEKMENVIAPLTTLQVSLPEFAAKLIGSMVSAYRANAALLRGIRQFVQSRANTAFVNKVSALEIRHFQHAVELFLSYGEEIRHPEARTAVSLGLMMIVGTLFQVLVWPTDPKKLKELVAVDDKELSNELTRAFLSYLDAKAG
jgi:AcrR family transcriptional regulator